MTETLEIVPADAPPVVTTPVPIVPCGDAELSRERSDFLMMLAEEGVSETEARAQSEAVTDQISFPLSDTLRIGESMIEGVGMFTNADIVRGALIAPARVFGKRTSVGRYVNHSPSPNSEMRADGNDIVLAAIRDIAAGEELTTDYRLTRSVVREIEQRKLREYHAKVDRLEAGIAQFPQTEVPTTHRFLPGMYIREAFAPAGSLLTSKEHLTDHPFVMLSGEQSIMEPDGSWRRIAAPFMGFTKAGSRRVVLIHSDTIMVTFHATSETDLDAVEKSLFRTHDGHLLVLPQKAEEIRNIQRGPNSRVVRGISE